jgi:hypothetical protein
VKAAVGTILVLLILICAAGAEDVETRMVFQLSENRGMWSSNASPRKEGGQNIVYFSLSYYREKFGVTLLGSHTDSSFINNGGINGTQSDFHLFSLLDSTLSGFYKLGPTGGFEIRAGLDLNLPTGRAGLSNRELDALMIDRVSQDLNLVTSFGRGFNIAPNAVVSKSLGKAVIGFGLRYESFGKYDPTTEKGGDDYDPGDVITVIGSVQTRPNKDTIILTDLSTTMSTRDRQADRDVFKQGTMYSLDVRFIRQYELFRSTYSASYSIQEKNQSLGTGGITTEDRNSNSNFYQLFININYPFTKLINVNGIAGYKNVLSNGRSFGDPLYDGGYSKLFIGAGMSFTRSKNFYWTVNLRLFQLANKADALEKQTATYKGFNFDIGLVYTFES